MHVVFHCAGCNLRFPAEPAQLPDGRCPRCEEQLIQVGAYQDQPLPSALRAPPARRLVALLDNIRSAFNVGSMLRTADGCGIEQVVMCGTTATPEHRRVAKTALGAEERLPWGYFPNALDAAYDLRQQGYHLYALEGGRSAENVLTLPSLPDSICLIVGNELVGIDPDLLALCDRTVAIPMRGHKRSLNVAVAFGIASYALLA